MAKLFIVLFFLGFSSAAAELKKINSFSVRIAGLGGGGLAKYTFDGSALRYLADGKKIVRKLSAKEITLLEKSIQKAPLNKWSQFWLNDGYLDGYLIFANFSIDGKKYHFEGMNGCPPGFGKLADSIQAIAGKTNHLNHWTDSERNSKQIKGTFESWSDDLEKQLEQKLQKREQEEKEAEKEKVQESKKPD